MARHAQPEIDRTLHRLRVPPEDRPDLSQEVLLKLHRALTSGALLDHPRAWLATVCRNTALDHFRRRETRQFRSRQSLDDDDAHLEVLTATNPEPERDLDARRFARAIEEAARLYEERAEQEGERRGHQVLAWFAVQVREASTEQVQAEILERYGRSGSSQTVWQWKARGSKLVQRLAERDEDRARGALMARAAAQVA
ncbi:MAG: hypothetical protein IPJ34_42335 [Myxococcales bacterium]|nr:hypothetical protein [Myxococcales bacterium]